MMLLDPDPAGEITASLSRDRRGMGDVVRRNLDGSVAAIPVACVLRVAQVRRRRLQRGSAAAAPQHATHLLKLRFTLARGCADSHVQ